MKVNRNLLNTLLACGIALGMVSSLAAQNADLAVAKVIRLKGAARYATGPNAGKLLKVGDIIRPGSVIQTADKSRLDFVLGDPAAEAAPRNAAAAASLSYQPTVEQNVVRMWENTLLGFDKMSVIQTGADEVSDTQLDLKAGHIFGMVKKMSAASKYEVKVPNGVAGIRGTIYDISAEGVVKVLSGSVVLAYVGPDGTVVTQVIMGLQRFDAPSNSLRPLPDTDKTDMETFRRDVPPGHPPHPVHPPHPPPPIPPSRYQP
jgi:FecR protein